MQQVIDGILYSPVLAHSLRRGDLISLPEQDVTWRVQQTPTRDGETAFVVVAEHHLCGAYGFECGWNEPVLRAVGAGVGGLL